MRMQLSRAQLDGNLDQLAADLPSLLEASGGSGVPAAFRARAEDILRSIAADADRRHAQDRIDAMLHEHGLAERMAKRP